MQLAPIAIAVMFAAPVAAVHAQQLDQTKAGAQAAERWLALTDGDKGAESWSAAGAMFQAAVSQKDWAAGLHNARAPYGALTTRTPADARFTRTLPGAPEADYVVIQYRSVFANRPAAMETVITTREADGSWKTVAYYIR